MPCTSNLPPDTRRVGHHFSSVPFVVSDYRQSLESLAVITSLTGCLGPLNQISSLFILKNLLVLPARIDWTSFIL